MVSSAVRLYDRDLRLEVFSPLFAKKTNYEWRAGSP